MAMSRRSFLKQAALCTAAGLTPKLVWAQASGQSGRNLIFINLRGGADGLSLCPYYEGTVFQTLQTVRPTIAVSPASVIKPFAQNGISSKLGLHPSFNLTAQAAGNGCALIQKYGIIQDPGRSHDTCQLLYSVGANGGGNTNRQGFLARIMDLQHWESFQVWGIQTENGPDFDTMLNPPMLVSSLDSIDSSLTYTENSDDQALILSTAEKLANTSSGDDRLSLLHESTNRILKNILRNVRSDILSQVVGGNTFGSYNDSSIGSSLRDAARILAAKAHHSTLLDSTRSTVLYLNNDGFDTHSDQANPDTDNLGTNLKNLGDNLAVFVDDLKRAGVWENTAIVLFSEFGRTVFENGTHGNPSAGTDHGWGSNTFVLGGSIKGGVYGDLPSTQELLDGDTNGLIPTTDYRDIFSDVIEWLSVDPLQIFNLPDYSRRRLGLF